MARFTQPPRYARLRRLPGDRRLYITDNRCTDAGYLASAETMLTSSDVPDLRLELEEHPYDLFGDGIDAATFTIRANRILLQDIQALADTVKPHEHAYHQLLATVEALRPLMAQDDSPVCGHEDVIDASTLGNLDPSGLCVWCSVRMKDDGDSGWIPA